MGFRALDPCTTALAGLLCTAWLGALLVRPSIATHPRIAVVLNTLSAMLFVLYCCGDPDLASDQPSQLFPAVPCKALGAASLALMAPVYLWMAWGLAARPRT